MSVYVLSVCAGSGVEGPHNSLNVTRVCVSRACVPGVYARVKVFIVYHMFISCTELFVYVQVLCRVHVLCLCTEFMFKYRIVVNIQGLLCTWFGLVYVQG